MERLQRRMLIVASAFVLTIALLSWATPASSALGSDWTKYMHDGAGTGYTAETIITSSNAGRLASKAGWPVYSGAISGQPVVYNNHVYWGSWDGHMNSAPLTGGGYTWSVNIGSNSNTACGSQGVVSTPDIASVTSGQTSSSYLFVGAGGNKGNGGGSAQMFALDPGTGATLWHTPIAPAPDSVIFSSPTHFTDPITQTQSVYIGVSSWCDEPLVQGKLVQLDATNGSVLNTFNVVPEGCVGGGIWGSPVVDPIEGAVYIATGNDGSCSTAEPYAFAVIKLRATDLTLLDAWQVPTSEQIADSDFGSTPTIFIGTVWQGGPTRKLVGVANKNGTYYIFDTANMHQGPMYRVQVAKAAEDPFSGGSISPSAWDGKRVYVAGGATKFGLLNKKGSLRALDPNNLGKPFWTVAMDDGPVLAAVTAAPGIVVVGEGKYTLVVNSATGSTLIKLPVKGYLGKNPAIFFGAPSIAHGVLYEGDSYGRMYAYSVGGT